jgi:hypothetical protein
MNYRKAKGGRKGRGRRITLEQLISSVGGLTPMAKTIVRDLKEKDEIDELFASVREAPKE